MARWMPPRNLLEEDMKLLKWRPVDLDPWLTQEADTQGETAFFLRKLKFIHGSYPAIQVTRMPSEIVTGVFMGTIHDAKNVDLLNRCHITHIVNCAGRRSLTSLHLMVERNAVNHLQLEMDDDEFYDVRPHFRQTNNYIRRAVALGGNVMICCPEENRSVAIMMGYLVGAKHMNLLEAAKLIKDLRHVALRNEKFMVQMIEYARESGLLDPMPM